MIAVVNSYGEVMATLRPGSARSLVARRGGGRPPAYSNAGPEPPSVRSSGTRIFKAFSKQLILAGYCFGLFRQCLIMRD